MTRDIGMSVRALIGVSALAVGLSAAVASADLTDEIFTLQAAVGDASGTFVVSQDDGWFDNDGNFFWRMNEDVQITSDDGRVLATLSRASVNIFADPVINMNFNVQAANQNTVFTVSSGLLSFPTINGAVGAASAGVTVTDVNGDGATLAPDGSEIYRAHYNGQIPGGTLFTTLLESPVSAGAFQSASATDEYPGGGNFVAIGDPVTSMSARWSFTVSAFDMASGSSTFIVVPAPAGAAVLGLAGLAIARRRR
ncbi:MAG TPA: hypothetical protein VFF69_05930 [Phycisphaerales bacterium]|nr:hypothetical protein [Phycisphaerales bacterium]